MASSYAKHSQRKFAESSAKTLVGLQKSEVKLKKMVDSLERQQNTAVSNIANHQQAMKMSWRRLEERRSTSPLMTRHEKKEKEEAKKKGMLLQSNTKLYVRGTPQVYSGEGEVMPVRPVTADDSVLGRITPSSSTRGYLIHDMNKSSTGPPPVQLTRAQTSPYISSPYNFRKNIAAKNVAAKDVAAKDVAAKDVAAKDGSQPQDTNSEGSDTQLSSSQDTMKSSSQPMLIKTSAINDKETLLKASNFMDIGSSSSGPRGFKNFYSERPRSQTHSSFPISPLVHKQVDATDPEDEEMPGEDEVKSTNSETSLAEQLEQIKNCRYIRHSRHYHPEAAARDDS